MGSRFTERSRPMGGEMVDWAQELAPDLIPVHNDNYLGRNVVVLGSFKAWYTAVRPYRERLRAAGFFPLAPRGGEIIHHAGTFEVLDSDLRAVAIMESRLGRRMSDGETAALLEGLFCRAILASDFVYVAGMPRPDIDDGDYVGLQVATELGIAFTNGPVYGTEISPTLDERDGYISRFAGYAAMIEPISPEALGERYATMVI